MEEKNNVRSKLHQKRYRQKQLHKGFARFELQVSENSKARFDALVAEAANEYTAEIWDRRQRLAKARARVFISGFCDKGVKTGFAVFAYLQLKTRKPFMELLLTIPFLVQFTTNVVFFFHVNFPSTHRRDITGDSLREFLDLG